MSLRQVFLPFTSALDPQAPTEQQKQALEKARGISASVHSCEQMEQVAKANNFAARRRIPARFGSRR